MRQHLLMYYARAKTEHSFTDDAGQVFDCIPISLQPASELLGGRVIDPPPPLPSRLRDSYVGRLDVGRTDRHGNTQSCPEGSVPVLRITLEDVSRFTTLEHFLRFDGRKRKPLSKAREVPPEDAAAVGADYPHRYAVAYQDTPNLGGSSVNSLWRPGLASGQIMSLSQIWCSAGSENDNSLQTAEAGWEVCPNNFPTAGGGAVLFIFWTGDNYKTTGAYNNRDKNFYLKSNHYPIDGVLNPVSAYGGAQVDLDIGYQFVNGDWWLYINGQLIGCWLGGIYSGGPLVGGASELMFGGETDGAGNYPPMGSGASPALGYTHAAYHRDIIIRPAAGGLVAADLTAADPSPGYQISLNSPAAPSANWGEYFFFGGPGGG